MKASRFLTFISVLALLITNTSCVSDDDYNTPDTSIALPDLNGTSTKFNAVVSRYLDAVADGDEVGAFELDEDPIYIEGYVISSDQGGNFFEELIIQNKIDDSDPLEDPRLGLKVEVNVGSLYNTFEFGRKVYVQLNGLAVGLSNGVYTVGKANGNSLEQIQAFEYQDFILRDPEVATLTPKVTSISDLSENDENTLIQLEDMQINRNQLMLTYAGEPNDQFDGFRTLESCADGSTISLQTSTFADFKSQPVPQTRGSIQGIFTRDFGDDFNVFVINSTSDVNFDNAERCDPIELDCGLASSVGGNNLFSDDFETQATFTLITGNGWTNFIQEGTEGWEAYSSGGTNSSQGISARVGSFSSGDASSIAWLITPEIDLDANTGVTMSFETSNSFSDGSTMELLFSNDWDGTEANITSATWGILPAAYITQDSDFFGSWFESGDVDLSCGTGTMHIAFKYTGSGQSDFDGTYELDFVTIDAQ